MSYKTILVHLDPGARSKERLDVAFDLGSQFDAHLVGLFAQSEFPVPAAARAMAGSIVEEAVLRQRISATQSAEAAFRAALARHPGARAEWRASNADALQAVRLSARYADLVITGQRQPIDEDDSGLARDFVEDLILCAGRPVLFLPYAGRFAQVGRRVLIAWNATREAARAVVDALPFLQRAESVQVVAFNPTQNGDDHGEIPGADISLYLARHGVKATAAQQHCAEIDIGAQILSRAADIDADLLVMGAYGHSRTYQTVLGGATRTIFESMTLPVLMSH
ncbi:MAG: universal stress protein [Betaproteobacteria bacterium]|nr:universal stress protein [Betaproteobacteria bacterium]